MLLAPAARARSAPSDRPSPAFLEGALCVHSGWHYTRHRRRGRPDYWLFGHGFWRTWDVDDRIAGGSGEGAWSGVVGSLYGGGMSFTVGTWNRAARLSRAVAFVSSTYAIASRPPREQLLAAWLIVRQDRGSWREWPNTARACGLR